MSTLWNFWHIVYLLGFTFSLCCSQFLYEYYKGGKQTSKVKDKTNLTHFLPLPLLQDLQGKGEDSQPIPIAFQGLVVTLNFWKMVWSPAAKNLCHQYEGDGANANNYFLSDTSEHSWTWHKFTALRLWNINVEIFHYVSCPVIHILLQKKEYFYYLIQANPKINRACVEGRATNLILALNLPWYHLLNPA